MSELKILVVGLLIVTAGCTGVASNETPTAEETSEPVKTPTPNPETSTPTSTPHATEPPTETPTETATPEPRVDPNNPYGKELLTVYADQSRMDRDVGPILRDALEFWDQNAAEYAGYDIAYTTTNTKAAADVVIVFEPVDRCGAHPVDENYTGCADTIKNDAPDTVSVEIDPDQSNPGIRDTLIHELGHTLGLSHDDEPQNYMGEFSPSPFQQEPMRVYVSSERGNVPSSVDREIERALNFYGSTEEIDRDQLSWKRVGHPDEAHFIIHYNSRSEACGERYPISCASMGRYGDQYKITLSGLDSSVIAWHVVFHMAPSFYEDIPEKFAPDADRDTRERWYY